MNLSGTFVTCRALLPAMVRRRTRSVVVIGSTTGKRPLFGRTPCAAGKLGLVRHDAALAVVREAVEVPLLSVCGRSPVTRRS